MLPRVRVQDADALHPLHPLQMLASKMQTRTFAAGEVLLDRFAENEMLAFVISGEVDHVTSVTSVTSVT